MRLYMIFFEDLQKPSAQAFFVVPASTASALRGFQSHMSSNIPFKGNCKGFFENYPPLKAP